MPAIVLVLLLVPLLVLGYRYFGKFLLVYPPAPPTGSGTVRPVDLAWVFLQRFAVLAGGVTVLGAALAAGWGWAPGFLWITAGGLVGGAVYAVVTLRAGGAAGPLPSQPLAHWAGPAATRLFRLLACLVLLALGWLMAGLLGRLLAEQPALVLPLALELGLAGLLAGLARRRPRLAWMAVPAALLLLAWPWILDLPVALEGRLGLRVAGAAWVSLDALLVWGLLGATAAGLLSGGREAGRVQAVMAGVLAAVWVLAVLGALGVGLPHLAAPRYNDSAPAGALPWLLLVLSGGALAGFQGLLGRVSLSGLAGRPPPRLLGFGVVLADMLLAATVLLAVSAGFADGIAWAGAFADWSPLTDPFSALAPLAQGAGTLLRSLGLPGTVADYVTGLTIASLALAGLAGALSALQDLGRAVSAAPWATPLRLRWGSVTAVGLVWIAARHGWMGDAPWQSWLTFGQFAGLALFAAGLAWLGPAWRSVPPLAPAALLVAIALHWALAWQLLVGWRAARLDLLLPALLLLALEAVLAGAVYWNRRRPVT